MDITAKMVKDLRERTGAGMMECKKALVECNGDIESAIEMMRKKGMAQADKKAGRIAADGRIDIALSADQTQAAMIEINCETDFVANGEDFVQFSKAIADLALAQQIDSVEALNEIKLSSGETVETTRRELIAKIGENVSVRRITLVNNSEGLIASYNHGIKIGVVVSLQGGNNSLGRDIAMHIAASKPAAIDESDVDADLIMKETEIFKEQSKQSGKPEEIIEKMVQGKVKKFLKEITLINQPFVKNPDESIASLLKSADAGVTAFTRFEVGEGIEKKNENFADEVASQVAAAKS